MGQGSGGGPKSRKGKEIASSNSLRHGLWSQQPVIPQIEDEGEWQALMDGVMRDHRPVGATEMEIVQEMAFQLWTRRRIRRAANAEILKSVLDMPSMYRSSARLVGQEIEGDTAADAAEFQREAERRLVPDERVLDRVIRYQAHTTRQIEKLERELRARQEARMQEEPGTQWIQVREAKE